MLRLVRSQNDGQDPPTHRSGTKPAALTLTREEQRHTRAALRNAARAYGGVDVLAVVLELPRLTLYGFCKEKRTIPGTFAIRLARAAGVSVEAVLTGAPVMAGRCPACGHRPGMGGAR